MTSKLAQEMVRREDWSIYSVSRVCSLHDITSTTTKPVVSQAKMDLVSPDSKAAEYEVDWLTELLPHHPIFSAPSDDNGASLLQSGGPSKLAARANQSEAAAQRKRLMEVRSTELLVAVNLPATQERKAATQIRIASLLEAKKAQSQPNSHVLPSYKVR